MSTDTKLPIRYVALGDSYTIGEGVAYQSRWPNILCQKLRNKGLSVKPPTIVAQTGWTTDELQQALSAASSDFTANMVSLLIGVNDQYRDYPFPDYCKGFTNLLNQAIAYAKNPPAFVFVVSIPDYGITPFGQEKKPDKIGREIAEYNRFARELATSKGIPFYDINPTPDRSLLEADMLIDDQLHPSEKMYKIWADTFIDDVFLNLKHYFKPII